MAASTDILTPGFLRMAEQLINTPAALSNESVRRHRTDEILVTLFMVPDTETQPSDRSSAPPFWEPDQSRAEPQMLIDVLEERSADVDRDGRDTNVTGRHLSSLGHLLDNAFAYAPADASLGWPVGSQENKAHSTLAQTQSLIILSIVKSSWTFSRPGIGRNV
ncbi:hypothetical protein WOLCODRAFT_163988 [Wolfiporia cocos MD-104 SS10]|uniref:Uncharacterized protein n=1 Tax=Wolfiporia cocos (strain MD-104) TaxID=742152 RepID=A0A2H3JMI0_WOLCO|nr:hypothetical protein WOLCODRAFT_163988 [Wolfiporia cocos MD-104 SS10]